jgi:hypothetical protein
MRKLIILLTILFLTNSVLCQTVENNDDFEKLFTETEIPPSFSGDLFKYFDSSLTEIEMPEKGRVLIDVIIDKAGKSSYQYSYDHTNGDVTNFNLEQLISKMNGWTPALQNGHAVKSIILLLLDIKNRKLIKVRQKSISDKLKYMINTYD